MRKAKARLLFTYSRVMTFAALSAFATTGNVYAAPPIVPSALPPAPATQGSLQANYQFGGSESAIASPPFSESKCDFTIPLPDLVSKLNNEELKRKAFTDELAIVNNRLQACVLQIKDTYKPPPRDLHGQALLVVAMQDCSPSSDSDYPDIYYDAAVSKGTDDDAMAIKLSLKTERFARCAAFANQTYPANTARAICNAVGPLGFGIGLYSAIFSKHWNSGLQGGVPFFASQLPNAILQEPACK